MQNSLYFDVVAHECYLQKNTKTVGKNSWEFFFFRMKLKLANRKKIYSLVFNKIWRFSKSLASLISNKNN